MKPRLYAHRGAAAELPENTLPSFARALEYGVEALETDVHMTSDGHVVVSHDPSGERMCGVPALFRESTLAEVRTWDAGRGFRDDAGGQPFAGKEFRVPTLDELLGEFPDVLINIDLKQRQPPIVDQVLDVLRKHDAQYRVILASFSLRTMVRVRASGYPGVTALPMIELGALHYLPRAVYRALPLTGEAAQVPVRAKGVTFASPEFLDKAHDLGLRVDYWTINDPQEAETLLQMGADGIMTDDPAKIAPVFKDRQTPN